jgi:hypothetical protein
MPVDLKQHDSYRIRDRHSFKHAQEISKPYGHIDEVLDWSKAELRGEWRWQLVEMSSFVRPGRYIFYFDDERDHFAFTLKWS